MTRHYDTIEDEEAAALKRLARKARLLDESDRRLKLPVTDNTKRAERIAAARHHR